MSDKVADLGEFGLISAITARLPQGGGVLVGPGDDAAVVAAPDGRVVATTDLLVEGATSVATGPRPPTSGTRRLRRTSPTWPRWARYRPRYSSGLRAPPDLPADWALGLADGLREECEPLGTSVVGGDVVRSELVVVAVTALGDLGGRRPVDAIGGAVGRRRRGVRAAGLGRSGLPGAQPRVPLPASAGGGPPAADSALRRRAGGGGPGRDVDVRRQ